MLLSNKWRFPLTLVAFLSGVLLISLIMANQAAIGDAAVNPNAELIEIINRIEVETEALEETVENRRAQIEKIHEQHPQSTDQLSDLLEELTWLRKRSGLTQVAGPGITVILDDNEAVATTIRDNDPFAFDPSNYIIHDKDLLYLVNDLKIGGAEAISINNQRIIVSSDIRCVGTVILVNSTRLAPPFEVKAIGDPEKLESHVMEGQIYPWLKSREFPVKLTKNEFLQLPTYRGNFLTSHLQVTKEVSETNEEI